MTLNEDKINLPRVITIKLQDKSKLDDYLEVYFGHRNTRNCITLQSNIVKLLKF